ncbi:hypothetical protein B0H13DRAFT_1850150 [Mycena leptocephala]|nr:hypothetical protein B0H13DRAFT_1850150 [Mycena leptocephala]
MCSDDALASLGGLCRWLKGPSRARGLLEKQADTYIVLHGVGFSRGKGTLAEFKLFPSNYDAELPSEFRNRMATLASNRCFGIQLTSWAPREQGPEYSGFNLLPWSGDPEDEPTVGAISASLFEFDMHKKDITTDQLKVLGRLNLFWAHRPGKYVLAHDSPWCTIGFSIPPI